MDDRFSPDIALRARSPLREFNQAGLLLAADVHVATTLTRLAAVDDPEVALGVAFAVRAPRLGHVYADLMSVRETASAEEQPSAAAGDGSQAPASTLPWPEPAAWTAKLAQATALVGPADGSGTFPLRISGTRLYLDRYFRQERALAASLSALAELRPDIGPLPGLAAELTELFPDADDVMQRVAAASAVMRNLTVIAGGPGTGKTTTIARIVRLMQARAAAAGRPEPLIALCAPTGKAAARMQEAVGLGASTIHKLLGWLPGGRFRHNASNRLAHDLVIVDETSMVSLTLMCHLVQAVRSDAQLVLVGDPDQLAAIEAGAVLRDIVGPAATAPQFSEGMRSILELTTAARLPAATATSSFGDGVAVLQRGHRFGAEIGALADAVRRGDEQRTLEALHQGNDRILWLGQSRTDLQAAAMEAFSKVRAAAEEGDPTTALTALSGFRILCAHRRGPAGVQHWNRQVEDWLAEAAGGPPPDGTAYIGRPLMITENDYELQLFNGDTGVIVADPGGQDRVQAVFDGTGQRFAPSRLSSAETVYAMTVHKSQGSQFEVAALVLPEADSPLLTRELLYTAVTRARRQLIVIGGEDAVRAAVARPLQRATGLGKLLWS